MELQLEINNHDTYENGQNKIHIQQNDEIYSNFIVHHILYDYKVHS
jgi:hypothetical protein